MEEQFYLNNPDWRDEPDNEEVVLGDTVVREKDIYLALEIMTPRIQQRFDRYPTIDEIENFIILAFFGE